jgi:hypothetical protein
MLKSKCEKIMFGTLLKVELLKKRSGHGTKQNVEGTPGPENFWKLNCSKSAHGCGAKHILKSKCPKHQMFAPFLDVHRHFSARTQWILQRDLQKCISRGGRSTRDISIRYVPRSEP